MLIEDTENRSIGELRNIALQQAQGEYITWFDDDDWHHPLKLETLVDTIGSYDWCGWPITSSWLVDTYGWTAQPYQGVKTPHHVTSLFRRDAVAAYRFPEISGNEDLLWLAQLQKHSVRKLSADFVPQFFVGHAANFSQRRGPKKYRADLTALQGLIGAAWGDTTNQLIALKERLSCVE